MEHSLCLLEEALTHGAFLPVEEVGEFLELGLLARRQVGWHLDIDADMEIAAAIALNILDAFAFQAKHRAGLGAWWNPDWGCPIERRNLDFCAERSLHETHRHFAKQVVAVTLENGMG